MSNTVAKIFFQKPENCVGIGGQAIRMVHDLVYSDGNGGSPQVDITSPSEVSSTVYN